MNKILIIILLFTSCKLYDDSILLKKDTCKFNNIEIEIYKFPSSATVNNNVHVLSKINNIEIVFCVFENYDSVRSYYFLQDTLFLNLIDSKGLYEPKIVNCKIAKSR